MTPHERPIPGPAADFGATLAAQLPVIETTRLRLRAPMLTDFDAWAEVLCGPASPHLGGPFDRDDAFTEFAACCGTWLLRGHGPWTVERNTDGEILGFVLIGFEPGDQEPELGYLFRPTAEGRGYATEAATAARNHAFATLGLDRLVSYIAPGNAPSIRVAERLGAVREGEVDGAQVWVHRPAARPATQGRRNEDAMKTSKRGD
ncbi:GNAT family N-acetyltransferase [Tabrizicola sp.]|uniref:GNAT family N-acetyltransferase n=1 Tax=Tabrizicola sp. TaxID=2005166 RepID=UPI003F2A0EF8